MEGMREKFYSALQEDFANYGTRCFLCRYWREHPRSQGGWARLKASYDAMARGEASPEDYLRTLLELLSRNKKIRLEHPTSRTDQTSDRLLKILGCEKLAELSRDARCQELSRRLAEGELTVSRGQAAMLHNLAAEAILSAEARAFFYDVDHRKKDRTLELMEAYYREQNITLRPVSDAEAFGELSPQEKADFETLFALLKAGKNLHVLIPVQLDSRSGAGVYIIGRAYFRKMPKIRRRLEEKKAACCYACLYWNEFKITKEYEVSFFWGLEDEDELDAACSFPDLTEALKWLENSKSRAMDLFQMSNCAPPPNCPPGLLHFFEPPLGSAFSQEEVDWRKEKMDLEERMDRGKKI